MEVDLSKAVKGSTVHFRCGGSAVVKKTRAEGGALTLTFDGGYDDGYARYATMAGFVSDGMLHPFDIIRIDPPAFNWDDVRPGQCFRINNKGLWYYVGKDPAGTGIGVFRRDQKTERSEGRFY